MLRVNQTAPALRKAQQKTMRATQSMKRALDEPRPRRVSLEFHEMG